MFVRPKNKTKQSPSIFGSNIAPSLLQLIDNLIHKSFFDCVAYCAFCGANKPIETQLPIHDDTALVFKATPSKRLVFLLHQEFHMENLEVNLLGENVREY